MTNKYTKNKEREIPMRINRIVGLTMSFLLSLSVLGCRGEIKTQTVAVVTFVDHPVLKTIESSFKENLSVLRRSNEPRLITFNAQGRMENLPDIAGQVLLQHPDLIITISTPVTQALMRQADTIQPIVFTFVTNPADLGDELTRTNSTGLSDAVNYGANLELLRFVFGDSVIVGILYNPNEANSRFGVETLKSLVQNSKTRLVEATVTAEIDIANAVDQLASNVDVIYVGGDNTVVGAIPIVLNSAIKKHIPVFASDIGSIQTGAIAGVSVDYAKLGKQSAEVASKVLDGDNPKSIPRIVLRGDQLVVNMTAAQQFGFKVPDSVLNNADIVFGRE